MTNQIFTIDQAMSDPALLGAALGDIETWSTWAATLKAALGLELTDTEAAAFAVVAGSRNPPTQRAMIQAT